VMFLAVVFLAAAFTVFCGALTITEHDRHH
jgi:hypothetical protein